MSWVHFESLRHRLQHRALENAAHVIRGGYAQAHNLDPVDLSPPSPAGTASGAAPTTRLHNITIMMITG